MSVERTVATTTHGRYLVDAVHGSDRQPLIVAFHGYSENAALQLERLRAVRGAAAWTLVSVQALHRFYRHGSNTEIAASWMTREDREQAIADNVAYVDAVVDAVRRESHDPSFIVLAGFSQGASMAYRAAALGAEQAAGVIALGGDIPPELPASALARIPRALLGRGVRDRYYDANKIAADESRLRAAGVGDAQVVEVEAGHEWTEPFSRACSSWISAIR